MVWLLNSVSLDGFMLDKIRFMINKRIGPRTLLKSLWVYSKGRSNSDHGSLGSFL